LLEPSRVSSAPDARPVTHRSRSSFERHRGGPFTSMSYFSGTPSTLPDQPVRTIDPKVEQLAHAVVDGLIRRLAAEPATPAASLLQNLADQLQEAAALRRLGVVRRTPTSETAARLRGAPSSRRRRVGTRRRKGAIRTPVSAGPSATPTARPPSATTVGGARRRACAGRPRCRPTASSTAAGWWPRSGDPAVELPKLIADRNIHGDRLGSVTLVTLNLTASDRTPPPPSRLPAPARPGRPSAPPTLPGRRAPC
jgi:hypothetical protein